MGRATFGTVSRSNTNAWNSCAHDTGINNQLPNHHGLFFNHPFSSITLYKNSNVRVLI